jgi:hypothetical protein
VRESIKRPTRTRKRSRNGFIRASLQTSEASVPPSVGIRVSPQRSPWTRRTPLETGSVLDFQKAPPKHNGLLCSAAWHLRKSGLYLATYGLIGAVTKGGKEPFFASIRQVSKYFDSDYETQRRVFAGMRRLGWLALDNDGNHLYVSHATWADRHPGQCRVREALNWDFAADPLVSELYAISGGKLRVFENQMVGARKLASDDEIAATFRRQWAEAAACKERGEVRTISPKKVLFLMFQALRKEPVLRQG